MTPGLAITAALLLDRMLGEPPRLHPLVGFGRWAKRIERALHGDGRARGGLAWALAVLPWVALAGLLEGAFGALVGIAALYLALGLRSLGEHAEAVRAALAAGDLPRARARIGWIVSRDTGALDEAGVAGAAVESVLENGCDAVFGALFWFALAGAPGVVLYRLANTLDAMWGYRNARYRRFGWAAARIDDVLNFVPARLTAASYALLGEPSRALRCWRVQAPGWKSPNAGPVMAAGAGSLGLALGGPACYFGQWQARPPLGEGRTARADDIARAVALVERSAWLWAVALLLGGLA